jgi:hypothetical protein
MLHRDTAKSGPLSEILFLGSGIIIFVPLLLIIVAAFMEPAAFR